MPRDWKQYYQDHKEHESLRKKKYYQENKAIILTRQERYNSENKSKIKAYGSEWQRNNKDNVNLKTLKYHQNNREKCRALCREYYQKNKDKIRDMRRKSFYGLSTEDFQKLYENQKGLCPICKRSLDRDLNIDHDHTTNKVRGILHRSCNLFLGNFEKRIEQLSDITHYLGV